MKARSRCLAVATAALAAAACASTVGATSSDNNKLAKSVLLGIGDFPHGWSDTKQKSDDGDHCLKPHFGDTYFALAEAETTLFSDGQVAFVSSFGNVYKSPAVAGGALDAVSFATVTKCLGDYFKGHQTSNIRYEGVAPRKLAFPHLGEHSRASRVIVQLRSKSGHTNVPFYVDAVLIQRKQLVGVLEFEELSSPVGAKLEERLARAVGQRMKQ